MKKKIIYLDSAANTPLDKRVFSAMKPYLSESFMGNSHAIHPYGIKALQAIEEGRETIAKITGYNASEIYFTSGATESNNWVLKSLALHELYEEKNPKLHMVVSAIEHASVLNTCKQIEKMGFHITYVQPNKDGVIQPKDIRAAIRFNTLLVCVMAINNETGAKNSINAIGEIAHKNKSLMMSDCTQFLTYGGKHMCLKSIIPNVDYITFSSHKIYGPTGVGCLIVRKRAPIYSLITGGSQEQGLRGGTSNTAGIVGMCAAYKLMAENNYVGHYTSLYDYLINKLTYYNIPYKINGCVAHKNIINLNFSAFTQDSDLASTFAIYNIACSAGSACDVSQGGDQAPSHVLTAMKIPEQEIHNSIRVSFSKYTTKKDIDSFIEVVLKIYKHSMEENK